MAPKRLLRILILLTLLLTLTAMLTPAPAQAAIFDVPCDGESADALVAAIHAANDSPGHDVIRLQADCDYYLYTIESVHPQNGPNGLPIITDALTIEGNGARLVRAVEGAEQFRLMMTAVDVPLVVRNIMLSNGLAPDFDDRAMAGGAIYAGGSLSLENVHVAGNRARGSGGGVYSRGSLVTLSDSFFEENEARDGIGGGIVAWGHLIVNDSQFIGNQSFSRGGAVSNLRLLTPTSVQIQNTLFEDNQTTSTSGSGGALYAQYSLSLSGSHFYRNNAIYGAAVYVEAGYASIAATGFEANTAIGSGGAVYAENSGLALQQSILQGNNGGFPGGAVYLQARDGSANRIVNNLIVDDGSEDDSATIYVAETTSQNAGVDIFHNTIVYGRDAADIAIDVAAGNDVVLANNIIAGYDVGINNAGATVRSGYNIFYQIAVQIHRGGILPYQGVGDQVVNPVFVDAAAGDYRIRGTSQAVDSGLDVGVNTDLLGTFRPQEAGIDRGAYEFVNLNRPPVAVDDAYVTSEETRLVSDPGVLANDSDPDGDDLRLTVVAFPPHASFFVINGDGTFTYVPEEGFTGEDSFVYQALDDFDSSNEATVTITVEPANTPPVAVEDGYETLVNTTLTIAAPGLLDNDQDPDGDSLASTLQSAPVHGSVSVGADGSFAYTPDEDFSGSDSFTYTASDGVDSSNEAAVSITVIAEEINLPPIAVGDTYAMASDTSLAVAAPGVLGNDGDVDGDALVVVLESTPSHGSLDLRGDGSFSYAPDAGFAGEDSFSYRAFDGEEHSAAANVTIVVTAAPAEGNQPPIAAADIYTTSHGAPLSVSAPGVLHNDGDDDGDSISALLSAPPENGGVFLQADGSFTYVPDAGFSGVDSFSYQAFDGHESSAGVIVNIHVLPATLGHAIFLPAFYGSGD